MTHQVRSYCLNFEVLSKFWYVIDGQKRPSTVARPSPDSRVRFKKGMCCNTTHVHVKIITAGASIHRWDKYHSTILSNVLLSGCYYVLEELPLLTLKVHISEIKANERTSAKRLMHREWPKKTTLSRFKKVYSVHSHS